jgi:hypothetical protein
MAEQQQIFYIYDTITRLETLDHREHRTLIANMAKRSRYFLVNSAKIDLPEETHGQCEFGPRFLEGAAAGTVMLGDHPENEAFKTHFDWPDAVIRVPYDSPNVAKVLAALDGQPDRLEEIRRNNVVQSLLRHDWVYRWRAILDIVGLEPTAGVIAREKRLKELAEVARSAHESPDSLIAKLSQPGCSICK